MGLVDNFEKFKKKLVDVPATRREDKLARGVDIAKFVAGTQTSEVDQEKYSEGWERIFGKKTKSP